MSFEKALRAVSVNAQLHAQTGDRKKYEEAHKAMNELLDEQQKNNDQGDRD